MADELAAVADELYGLAPEDFVAERDARAKQLRTDGDRDLAADVRALPRPTAAAWLLNQLARRQPDAVQELVSLGAELRAAQQSLDGDQLRALDRQRRQVVRAFSRQAAELAADLGRPLSGSVADQVDETLRAAVADEEAGEALLTGTLTTALSYVGMGEGSVSRAVAVPGARPSGPRARKQPGKSAGKQKAGKRSGRKQPAEPERPDEVAAARQRRLEETRTEVAEAEQAAEEAVDALAERERELAAADERHGELAERLAELRAELERVGEEAAEAESARDEARRQRDVAASEADEVRQTLETARERLDQLGD